VLTFFPTGQISRQICLAVKRNCRKTGGDKLLRSLADV
jgi:hypothetical protein